MLNIKELLLKIVLRISALGKQYRTSWTASSSNTGYAKVTGELTLPTGTYIVTLKTPVCSQTDALFFGIYPFFNSTSTATSGKCLDQYILTQVISLAEPTTIYAITGMSRSTTYTYLERGYLEATRIA